MLRIVTFIGFVGFIVGSQDVKNAPQIWNRLQSIEKAFQRKIERLDGIYQSKMAALETTYQSKLAGLEETYQSKLAKFEGKYQRQVAGLEKEVHDMTKWVTDHLKQGEEGERHTCLVGCKKGIANLRGRVEKVEQTCASIETNRSRRLLLGSQGTTPLKVAFYAQLSSAHTSTGYRQPIKFEKAVTNVGNAYDPTDGVFVAPVSGVYVFFWNILNDHNSDIHTTLSSSQGVLGNTFTGKPVGLHNEGSGLVVAHLNDGAHVWVEKEEAFGDFLQVFSSFSGFLLFADV